MKPTIRFTGAQELGAKFRQVSAEAQGKSGRGAINAAKNVLVKEQRALVPVLAAPTRYRKPGTVRDAIGGYLLRSGKGDYDVTALLQVRALSGKKVRAFKQASGLGSAQNPNDPYYWRFLEFGTRKMRAFNFMRRGFAGAAQRALDKLGEVLNKRLIKEIGKGQ